MESKQVLTEAFGEEIGKKLFGAAVKLSAIHNVDLDDVIQDMTIEALTVRENYGFIHINTVILRTKNALYAGKAGFRYGNNKYHTDKGESEVCLSDLSLSDERRTQIGGDDEDYQLTPAESVLELLSDQAHSDLYERVAETLTDLDAETRAIAGGLVAGFSKGEIAAQMGKPGSFVSLKMKTLQAAFAWAA